ncbi:MAG: hypothetical protein PHX51_04375 [Clostridia bacterium]|nr:hypothetical protein [Clostridia bacterium]
MYNTIKGSKYAPNGFGYDDTLTSTNNLGILPAERRLGLIVNGVFALIHIFDLTERVLLLQSMKGMLTGIEAKVIG